LTLVGGILPLVRASTRVLSAVGRRRSWDSFKGKGATIIENNLRRKTEWRGRNTHIFLSSCCFCFKDGSCMFLQDTGTGDVIILRAAILVATWAVWQFKAM
jgi:hypothetical protein